MPDGAMAPTRRRTRARSTRAARSASRSSRASFQERDEAAALLLRVVVDEPVPDARGARQRQPALAELGAQLLEKDPVAADERGIVLADVRLAPPVRRRRREVDAHRRARVD